MIENVTIFYNVTSLLNVSIWIIESMGQSNLHANATVGQQQIIWYNYNEIINLYGMEWYQKYFWILGWTNNKGSRWFKIICWFPIQVPLVL